MTYEEEDALGACTVEAKRIDYVGRQIAEGPMVGLEENPASFQAFLPLGFAEDVAVLEDKPHPLGGFHD